MKKDQTLSYLTQTILDELQKEFIAYPTNLVLVQGDTTSSFTGALAAFYEKIPVGHIEAGLRTNKMYDPFPEEINRRLISQLATLHFAPTENSKTNLENSGVNGKIIVTGNTVIDSFLTIAEISKEPKLDNVNWSEKKILLATVHRRENWGNNLLEIIKGFKMILDHNKDVQILLPMHKNQNIQNILIRELGSYSRAILVNSLNYVDMVGAIKYCELILTDSGGIQEEAPSLGKPVLVLRNTTERPEAIEAGTTKLIGIKADSILKETNYLLNNQNHYNKMAKAANPFGDGKASQKIYKSILKFIYKK